MRIQLFNGCVIAVDDYDNDQGKRVIHYNIHQTSVNASIEAVTNEFKEKIHERAKCYDDPDTWVVMFYVSNGDLPPEKDQYRG